MIVKREIVIGKSFYPFKMPVYLRHKRMDAYKDLLKKAERKQKERKEDAE